MYERAELSCGTYEIVATREYMVRAPQPVIHVFCIDVSQPAMASGATAATCQCIEQVLDSLQGEGQHRPGVGVHRGVVWMSVLRAAAPNRDVLARTQQWHQQHLPAVCVTVFIDAHMKVQGVKDDLGCLHAVLVRSGVLMVYPVC